MPVITCPKCQGKLKFPDDSPARRVKCPTCGNVFMSSEGLDAKSPAASELPPPSNSGKRSGSKADVDVDRRRDDDDRPSRRRDDDDDDRDRRRSRRDDDEDDDRERSRSRRRDDDDDDDRRRSRRDDDDDRDRRRSRRDDDEDDRDRRRSRRRDDDDDDDRDAREERRRRDQQRSAEGQYNRAGLACMLNFIAGWLQVGGLAILAFIIFLAWCGVTDGLKIFAVVAGLLGLGCWLTSAAGFGIGIAGPRERGALGFSIATAATAGLHLMFIIIIATSRNHSGFGGGPVGGTVDVAWDRFVTSGFALSQLLFFAIASEGMFRGALDGAILPVFANLAEVARTILFLLYLRATMLSLKEKKVAHTCMTVIVGYAIGAGVLILLGMMFGGLLQAVRPTRPQPGDLSTIMTILRLYSLVLPLVLIGLHVWVNLVVKQVKGHIDYRR